MIFKTKRPLLCILVTISFALAQTAAAGETGDKKQIFPTALLNLADQKIMVELADTPERREQGLMYRTSLADNTGMLFIFDSPQMLGFWMRNTLIPLSIGYFDDQQKLIEVLEMIPASDMDQNPPIYRSSRPAKFALEMAPGWFSKKKIKPGTRFEMQKVKVAKSSAQVDSSQPDLSAPTKIVMKPAANSPIQRQTSSPKPNPSH